VATYIYFKRPVRYNYKKSRGVIMLSYFLRRIAEKAEDVHTAPVLLAALGDSVTQGCMQINVLDPVNVYHQVLKCLLERRYPQTTFSVINAGVSGDSAAGGLKRLDRDVLRHDPDLVLLGFALNDACGGLEQLDNYLYNMREIVVRIRKSTSADIIVLTPNFMASGDNEKIAPEHRQYTETIINCQNNGVLHQYVERLRQLAIDLQILVADVYAEWEKMAVDEKNTTNFLINGLNHPDVPRQHLIAEKIFDVICQYEKHTNQEVRS